MPSSNNHMTYQIETNTEKTSKIILIMQAFPVMH